MSGLKQMKAKDFQRFNDNARNELEQIKFVKLMKKSDNLRNRVVISDTSGHRYEMLVIVLHWTCNN